MTAVITGDIIKSQDSQPTIWLQTLKQALSTLDKKRSDNTVAKVRWEVYRGDSFQIEITDARHCFEAALYIKACVKTVKNLDVRMAIGIGAKSFEGDSITESNGEAFQFSGETLETLKKEKVNLKIKTNNEQLNNELNLYFRLALIAMNSWTPNSAEIVKLSLEQPKALQKELASQIGISQNTVSERQKRANLDELMELDTMFRKKIDRLLT